jgi:hypothetical protein
MSLWRTTRNELAGAWRSLRYDLHRHSEADARRAAAFHDVTPHGLSIFGDPIDDVNPEFDEYDRSPRRRAAVIAFGTLAVVGAAGSYFAVVNGLGALLEEPDRADTVPLAAEAGPLPLATGLPTRTARPGSGSTLAPVPKPPAQKRRIMAPSPTVQPRGGTTVTKPPRVVVTPDPSCPCGPPPVPTPTAPTGRETPPGYPSSSPSPSPSGSASSPTASPSAGSSPSAAPGTSGGTGGGAGLTVTVSLLPVPIVPDLSALTGH